LSCCWKHHRVLFLIVRHVLAMMDRIVINGHLFPFFLSLFPWKLQFDPLCYLYFNFSPYSFDFEYFSWTSYRSFICFQFHPSIPICSIYIYIYIFFFWVFGWIDFFSISLFNQNFIFIFYFIFILILLIVFFPFSSINVSFQFYPSIKNKIYFVF